jgi:hypothetical protein
VEEHTAANIWPSPSPTPNEIHVGQALSPVHSGACRVCPGGSVSRPTPKPRQIEAKISTSINASTVTVKTRKAISSSGPSRHAAGQDGHADSPEGRGPTSPRSLPMGLHENHVGQALSPVHRDQRRQGLARFRLKLSLPWSRSHGCGGDVTNPNPRLHGMRIARETPAAAHRMSKPEVLRKIRRENAFRMRGRRGLEGSRSTRTKQNA